MCRSYEPSTYRRPSTRLATCRPAAERSDVSPGWHPSCTPSPDRCARPMIRSEGMIPPHFDSRTFKRSAVPIVHGRNSVGKAAERLVEHDRYSQSRAELGKREHLGVRNRLFEGRRPKTPERLDTIDQLGRRPRLVGVEPDVHAPAQEPPHFLQPPGVILSLGSDLDFHLMKAVNPDLQGRRYARRALTRP